MIIEESQEAYSDLATSSARKLDERSCILKEWDDFSVDSCYAADSQEVVFTALVPDNSWLSIGFGATMNSTDMIAWFVTDKVGETRDYWSTKHMPPTLDTESNLVDAEPPQFDSQSGKMKFVTRRKLDTGDQEQDFVVKLDEDIPMCYGFKKGTSKWVKHDEFGVWSIKFSASGEVRDGGLDETELLRNFDFEAHGWWLWSSWFFVGILLLVTKRYAKRPWTAMHYLHCLLGYFVLVVTIVFSSKLLHWDFTASWHHAFGTTCLFLTILGSLSGTVTAGVMRAYNGDKPWSEKEKVERIAKIHRWAGYIMLLVGNVTCMTGIGYYFNEIL